MVWTLLDTYCKVSALSHYGYRTLQLYWIYWCSAEVGQLLEYCQWGDKHCCKYNYYWINFRILVDFDLLFLLSRQATFIFPKAVGYEGHKYIAYFLHCFNTTRVVNSNSNFLYVWIDCDLMINTESALYHHSMSSLYSVSITKSKIC